MTPGRRLTVEHLKGSPGSAVLAFVTETPATETVRKVLYALPAGADQADTERKVIAALFRS